MQLVTGATGHIGNVLVRQLLARGEKVRALVRGSKVPAALQGLSAEIFTGDMLDPDSLKRALEGVEVVHHLAARINLCAEPDPDTERVNLEGTRNLLKAAMAAQTRRFVYASSIYAMKTPEQGVIDETCPFDPHFARGTYDRSKAAASLAVLQAAREGLDAVLLCPTAVVGPFDFQVSEAGRGILFNMPTGIKFTVDGAYDMVDVRDVARGFLLAAEKGRKGEVYILGGERLTVDQVSQIIWKAAGGWHLGVHLPDWVADMAGMILPFFDDDPIVTPYSLAAIRSNSFISHAKASKELGYAPRPAARAIEDAVSWLREEVLAEAEEAETMVEAAA